MSTKPLHVLTAEALGWKDLRENQGLDGKQNWIGVEPHGGLNLVVPRYDTSWCSSGVLVSRFQIGVMWDHGQWIAHHMTEEGHDQYAGGDRPTEAICRLVVHLSKEGKLKV